MLKILVVDDEPTLRRVLTRSLRRKYGDVHSAESKARALEMLADNNNYDVVLSDNDMEHKGAGIELLTYVGEEHPRAGRFFMTCLMESSYHNLGFDACFDKPLTIKNLTNAIDEYVERKG